MLLTFFCSEVELELLNPSKGVIFVISWPKEQERQGSENVAKWDVAPKAEQKPIWSDLRSIILYVLESELGALVFVANFFTGKLKKQNSKKI